MTQRSCKLAWAILNTLGSLYLVGLFAVWALDSSGAALVANLIGCVSWVGIGVIELRRDIKALRPITYILRADPFTDGPGHRKQRGREAVTEALKSN